MLKVSEDSMLAAEEDLQGAVVLKMMKKVFKILCRSKKRIMSDSGQSDEDSMLAAKREE